MNREVRAVVDPLLDAAGFTDCLWVSPSSMIVAQWVRMKCMFGCPDYGKNASCPPNVPTVSECRDILSEYSMAVLIHLVCDIPAERRKEWCRTRQKDLLEAERKIFLAGYERAFLLSFDNCNLCDECVPSPSACLQPCMRRPTMEAFAIDVYSSVNNYGYEVSVRKSPEDPEDRFALILVK
jgi:predicted metal-binding protein